LEILRNSVSINHFPPGYLGRTLGRIRVLLQNGWKKAFSRRARRAYSVLQKGVGRLKSLLLYVLCQSSVVHLYYVISVHLAVIRGLNSKLCTICITIVLQA